jgi:hypothetical protein
MTENKEIHFYSEIADKLNNNLILCNNITDVDESVIDNIVYGDYWEEDFKAQEEEGKEEIEYPEIYQYFLLDCNEDYIKHLQEHYPELIYSYSEKLDLYVLCVHHWGTSWTGVATEYRE